MNNIRIWSEDNKRCEAIWLGYLLTLCGCQVWKGQFDARCCNILKADDRYRYVDILLLDSGNDERHTQYVKGIRCLSESKQLSVFVHNHSYVLKPSVPLELDQPKSLEGLMSELSKFIVTNTKERLAVLRLTNLFVKKENALSRCIYTITEMFCSRRINYAEYRSVDVLIQAISEVEEWLHDYISGISNASTLTYVEMFTIIYLQNLVDEAYIKAKQRGGYDVSRLLRNANYMLSHEVETDAVLFLKLQILHNSVNFVERPDEILRTILNQSPPEYIDKAFCEVGDIYREDRSKVPDMDIVDYYEAINCSDIQNFSGLYRAGLVYQERGKVNFKWYREAREKYKQIISLIGAIDIEYRTPQEFEYFYKAKYGKIKMAVELDKSNGVLTQEKKVSYQNKLEKLISDCINFKQIFFWKKMYGRDYMHINLLMNEKMEKVQGWAKSLINDMN